MRRRRRRRRRGGREGGREGVGEGEPTTTKPRIVGGDKGGSVANVFLKASYSVAYVTSVANPPRGTRGRKRMSTDRISSSGSGRSKGGGTPPRSVSLGCRSGFVIAEDG